MMIFQKLVLGFLGVGGLGIASPFTSGVTVAKTSVGEGSCVGEIFSVGSGVKVGSKVGVGLGLVVGLAVGVAVGLGVEVATRAGAVGWTTGCLPE